MRYGFAIDQRSCTGCHAWRYADRRAARQAYRSWIALARPTVGPGGERRPEFLMRPVKPKRAAYRLSGPDAELWQ